MARKRKIDIMDLLSQEMCDKADELGYSFLKECGYDTDNAMQSATVRSRLKKKLEKDGRVLTYKGLINEKKEILIYFHLVKKGTENSDKPEILLTSKGIKFVPKEGEVVDEQ